MPKNKAEFVFGRTYVTTPDGRSFSLEGDHTQDPTVLEADYGPNPLANTEQAKVQRVWGKLNKQLAVDLGTQLPITMIDLMTGGKGSLAKTALKGGTSFLTGLGLDQAAFPEKSTGESAEEAAFNSLVGIGIPGASKLFRGLRIGPPRIFTQSNRLAPGWGITGLVANMLPTFGHAAFDPAATATIPIEKSLAEIIAEIPKPATRGPGGKFLKQAAIDAANQLYKEQKRKVVLESMKKAGITNLPGLVGNAIADILTAWDTQ